MALVNVRYLKRATVALCGFNIFLALYLTALLFTPSAHSLLAASEHAKSRLRRDSDEARAAAEPKALVERVKCLQEEAGREASTRARQVEASEGDERAAAHRAQEAEAEPRVFNAAPKQATLGAQVAAQALKRRAKKVARAAAQRAEPEEGNARQAVTARAIEAEGGGTEGAQEVARVARADEGVAQRAAGDTIETEASEPVQKAVQEAGQVEREGPRGAAGEFKRTAALGADQGAVKGAVRKGEQEADIRAAAGAGHRIRRHAEAGAGERVTRHVAGQAGQSSKRPQLEGQTSSPGGIDQRQLHASTAEVAPQVPAAGERAAAIAEAAGELLGHQGTAAAHRATTVALGGAHLVVPAGVKMEADERKEREEQAQREAAAAAAAAAAIAAHDSNAAAAAAAAEEAADVARRHRTGTATERGAHAGGPTLMVPAGVRLEEEKAAKAREQPPQRDETPGGAAQSGEMASSGVGTEAAALANEVAENSQLRSSSTAAEVAGESVGSRRAQRASQVVPAGVMVEEEGARANGRPLQAGGASAEAAAASEAAGLPLVVPDGVKMEEEAKTVREGQPKVDRAPDESAPASEVAAGGGEAAATDVAADVAQSDAGNVAVTAEGAVIGGGGHDPASLSLVVPDGVKAEEEAATRARDDTPLQADRALVEPVPAGEAMGSGGEAAAAVETAADVAQPGGGSVPAAAEGVPRGAAADGSLESLSLSVPDGVRMEAEAAARARSEPTGAQEAEGAAAQEQRPLVPLEAHQAASAAAGADATLLPAGVRMEGAYVTGRRARTIGNAATGRHGRQPGAGTGP